MLNENIPPSKKIQNRVERIVSWHRPLNLANKSYSEMLELFKQTDSRNLAFGSENSIYFLVKWADKDFNLCTWEDEYFIKSSYSKIIEFGIKKANEIKHSNGINVNVEVSDGMLREVNSVPFNKMQKESIKNLILKFDKKKNSIISTKSDTKELVIGLLSQIYLQKFTETTPQTPPSLLICEEKEIIKWEKKINAYFPGLNYITYSIFNEAEDLVSRYEFYSSNKLSIKFDLLFVSYQSFDFYSKYLLPLQWKCICIETKEDNKEFPAILKKFGSLPNQESPEFRLLQLYDMDEVADCQIKEEIITRLYNRINAIRFINSSFLKELNTIACFAGSSPAMIEFYLNFPHLFRNKVSELDTPTLESILNKLVLPISIKLEVKLGEQEELGEPGLTMMINKAVLQLSNFQKRKYKALVLANLELLIKIDESRIRPSTKEKLLGVVDSALKICNQPVFDVHIDEEEIVRRDTKLRWILKFIQILRSSYGRRIVILVDDNLCRCIYQRVLKKKVINVHIYSLDMSIASSEVGEMISKFNSAETGISILLIDKGSLSIARGVISGHFIAVGGEILASASLKQRLWGFISMKYINHLNVISLVAEGIEEKISDIPDPSSLPLTKLNKFFKNKINFMKIRNDYVEDYSDRLFIRLLDGSLRVNSRDHAIIDHTEGKHKSVGSIYKYLKYSLFFENLKEDVNSIVNWSEIRGEIEEDQDEEGSHNIRGIIIRKRMMKLETSQEFEPHTQEESEEDQEFESFLGKRFIAPRLGESVGPRPEYIFGLDFVNRTNLLEFLVRYGLNFTSFEELYKKYCIFHPEGADVGSSAHFQNIREYLREFLIGLGLRNSRAFHSSILFNGFSSDDLNIRIVSLTIISKLVNKYEKKPELFFNEGIKNGLLTSEFVELQSDHIGIRDNRTYDYSSHPWNNYDDYCLLLGIKRHGFGEWKAILSDRRIWEKHIKAGEGESILHILLMKLNISHYNDLKNKPKMKG